MRTPLEEYPAPQLLTETEQAHVREQMQRLLETTHFRNSRRYPALLRFIVEETLAGRSAFLKERFLGVNVFDRPTDYDTAADPIVRVTIAEIRKRIAQYYHDEAHDSELRIELLPGSYIPEFRTSRESHAGSFPEPAPQPAHPIGRAGTGLDGVTEVDLAGEHVGPIAAAPGVRWRAALRLLPYASAALLLLSLIPLYLWMRPRPLDLLWAPLVASGKDVLFCIPTDVGKQPGAIVPLPDASSQPFIPGTSNGRSPQRDPRLTTFLQFESLGENVVLSDVVAALKISSLLATHHRETYVKLNTSTTLDDLREGPSVLIGGLDNQWSLRAIAGLRYRFAGDEKQGFWISDLKNPGDRRWSLDLLKNYGAVTRDYALVARIRNQQTGQQQMIVAGIGMSGTAAAGEFLTDPAEIANLARIIGPALKDRDFEAVLGTDVINGMAGNPMILTTDVR